MLRTRLASLALAAGLTSLCGCMSWGGFGCSRPSGCCPAPSGCCPTSPCCGDSVSGFEGPVVATPCCNSHGGVPGPAEGPVLMPQDGVPPGAGLPVPPVAGLPVPPVAGLPALPPGVPPLPPADNSGLPLSPNPRLVPSPQAPATPYTPTRARR